MYQDENFKDLEKVKEITFEKFGGMDAKVRKMECQVYDQRLCKEG